MNLITVYLIALGLAMDAFAVSIASGVVIKRRQLQNAFKFGIFFGSFQMIMPVLGWAAGVRLKGFITGIDHWIAFGLLVFIGGKMIYGSFRFERTEEAQAFGFREMLLLAVATSIDALAIGLSFALLDISIIAPILIIGAVTFTFSFFGVFLGSTVGHFFEKKLEAAGGLVLIGIGIKILLEHLR